MKKISLALAVLIIFPSLILDNALNACGMNSIFFSQHRVAHFPRNVLRSYLINLNPCEFGAKMVFTSGADDFSMPSLFNFVPHVVSMSSNPKVRRINARWIVAFMADKKTFGYFSKMNQPTESVCAYGMRESRNTSRYTTVSSKVYFSFPNPTRGCVFNSRKETVEYAFGESLRSDVIWDRYSLHNEFVSLCHALGGYSHARAPLYYHQNKICSTKILEI